VRERAYAADGWTSTDVATIAGVGKTTVIRTRAAIWTSIIEPHGSMIEVLLRREARIAETAREDQQDGDVRKALYEHRALTHHLRCG